MSISFKHTKGDQINMIFLLKKKENMVGKLYKKNVIVSNLLICLALTLTSGIVQFSYIWNSESIISLFLFSILFIFKKKNIKRKDLIKLIIFILVIVMNLFVYGDNLDGHVALILIIISGFILNQSLDWILFQKYYIRIIAIICVISLVCFSIFIINPVAIINNVPLVKYWDLESRYIGFYNFPGNQYSMRNFGPYHEGGMFAIFICLALLVLFERTELKTKVSKVIALLYVITVITTFSTTGMLLLVLIFSFKLIPNISMKFNWKALLLLVIAILGIVWEETIFGIIKNKLHFENDSFSARSRELIIFNNNFWDHPIMGVGYQNNSIIKENGLENGTNGLLSLFLQFGLVGGLPILVMYIDGMISFSKKKLDILLYLLFIGVAISSEPTIFSPLFICFAYGFHQIEA